MVGDVKCPYCDEWQEICHDDGAGYSECQIHQQYCTDCDKLFAFTTSISYYYEAMRADCLNGGKHEFEKVFHIPRRWPEWVRCKNCGHEDKGKYVEETKP